MEQQLNDERKCVGSLIIEEDFDPKSSFVLLTPSDAGTAPFTNGSNTERVIPTRRLYLTVAIIVLGTGFPLGWNVSQLNAPAFHSKTYCKADNLIEEKCVVFPGHSNFEWTAAVNALLLGAALGSYVSWYPATVYGRKGATVFQAVLGIVAALLQAFSPHIYILVAGRFLSGITAGISTSVASVYIGEIAPVHLRGPLGSLIHLSIVTTLLAATCMSFVWGNENWRYLAGFPLLAEVVIVLTGSVTLVESPKWYVQNGRLDEARVALNQLYRDANAEERLAELVDLISASTAVVDEAVTNNHQNESLWDLKYRKSLYIAMGSSILNQLSGITNVFFFSSILFEDAGLSDVRVGNVILSAVNVAGSVVAVFLFNKYGRRRLLLISTIGMTLTLAATTAAMVSDKALLAIALLSAFVFFFDLGPGPAMWIIIAEIYPISLRAQAQSLGSVSLWTSSFVAGMVFPSIESSFGNWSFSPYVLVCIIFVTFVYKIVPETRNKSVLVIQQELQK